MTVRAWAHTTGVAAGDAVRLRVLAGGAAGVPVAVWDTVREERVLTAEATTPEWELVVPADWPSSLYCLVFGSHERPPGRDDTATHEVYLAVRPLRPGADVLVSVPFLTWQAYNRLAVPGEGLYLTEQPDRAVRVGFDRPGGGPAGYWEQPFYRWLLRRGYRADYCSAVDLHTGAVDPAGYRLLVIAGHDEYWTREQRDRVEAYTRDGGNVAFFGGNTCWWQVRLEDGGRTLVCYRDALRDPVATTDPSRATVEWSSAPVDRPENTLTGVSFRHGAGCWEDMSLVGSTAYTARFADHWVFAGTGLRDGDAFATGAVGYETDAALYEEVDGVPRATGRDGTPPGFVVLATAELEHWRAHGQGGRATMGVLTRGRGTVFTASTVSWPQRLDDPVVDRISRNVVDRLAGPGALRWDDIGPADGVLAVTACEHRLYALDAAGTLLTREWGPQNLRWRPLERTGGLRALAAPREALAGRGVELVGLLAADVVAVRTPDARPGRWDPVAGAPPGTVDLAVSYDGAYALTADTRMWRLPLGKLAGADASSWQPFGALPGAFALTATGGHLLALRRGADGSRLCGRLPVSESQDGPAGDWIDRGDATGCTALAAYAGRVVAVRDGRLHWRPLA